jgi:hypothetical protein
MTCHGAPSADSKFPFAQTFDSSPQLDASFRLPPRFCGRTAPLRWFVVELSKPALNSTKYIAIDNSNLSHCASILGSSKSFST